MKVGATPWDLAGLSARSLAEQAATAEALGYESFWLPESHFNPNAIPDPLMLLAAVAAATDRIRLATTSYLLPLRHPLQAAEQVAVLDQLSGGRVTLGIGRGFAPAMLKAFDVAPKEKRRLFESCLATMKEAWSGNPIEVGETPDGEPISITLDPLPVQEPHPPLWVAAFGPKALAQAGRLGLPYLASPMETMNRLEGNYARHAEAAADAGHEVIDTVPVMRTVFLTRSDHQGRSLREHVHQQAVATGRITEEDTVDDWTIIGDRHFVSDRIAEYRERLKVSHLIVTRLRIGGVEKREVEASMAELAELIGIN
jgi:alkanesulfonate monooxygenase SsuD/methylene tetrahydromethanopterin reductase-like flavin-dependent oxidoreductase (luciferase family)